MYEIRTVIVELERPIDSDDDYLVNGISDEHYGVARELVRCKDCKHKTKCFSEVVMIDKSRTADIYESVEWCSLGERKT